MGALTSRDSAADEPTPACRAAAEYGVNVRQLEYILTLTPAERLRRHDAALAFVVAAREAGIRFYGY
jgi:hypothetical protein